MLERRRPFELVPDYSLTGDLLSFMRCGLQYRYQNGSALPPSRPVQMWFGEFIHGVMETAYRMWLASQPTFPWPCTQTPFASQAPAGRLPHDIGSIGDLVEATLSAGGKIPRSRHLRNSGYRRAEHAVNTIGPDLFPLILSAEERVIGTRPLPVVAPNARARMYAVHGVMDVLSSVSVAAGANNSICNAVRAAVSSIPANAEIIVDYKGSRRPNVTDDYWAQGDWQLQMYAWLRSQQPAAAPVAAGVLLYINELAPGEGDLVELKKEIKAGTTDVAPVAGSADDYALRTWQRGAQTPSFSRSFRMARVIRVVPITGPSTAVALTNFDAVVQNIESCVALEAQNGHISGHWSPSCKDGQTCVACDFRHFCPSPFLERANASYVPPAPDPY
jgi:hypothetical protein